MKSSWRNRVSIISFVFVALLVFVPLFATVYAVDPCTPNPCPTETPICYPSGTDGHYCTASRTEGGGTTGSPKICDFTTVIMNGFNMIVALFPFVGLAILMYGAFLWATASSDPQKVQQSQQTLTYGVIGLIIGLSAIAIIGTLQMLLIGNDKFKWISEDGVLRVDFCLEEYQEGSNGPPLYLPVIIRPE